MDSAGYVALGRQSGLMREMQIVANNIANLSTNGFRREALVFAEHVAARRDAPSLSLANGTGRVIDLSQATLAQTGGSFDLAIEGEGFFLLQTPEGERLTRAGHFTPSAEGTLVSPEGHILLDTGGAPVFVPPGVAVAIGADGTLSGSGEAMAQIGLWMPEDMNALRRSAGGLFDGGALIVAENAQIRQGFLEESNVNPVAEIARMIEVQRAYEAGQNFLDAEDERARNVIRILGA